MTCFDVLPPNVAMMLVVSRSKSAGATYTWVVSYCGPTETLGIAATGPASTASAIDKNGVNGFAVTNMVAVRATTMILRIGFS
jgi:flavin reductase (DIM6/NTAB) family NADH-FMN oxidoreductase RutF